MGYSVRSALEMEKNYYAALIYKSKSAKLFYCKPVEC